MTHELLYTSASRGLKPGSYGFCTVMATEGIPKVLQDRLESLSGYEHAFGLTDSRAQLNPVNYAHMIVTVLNQRLHLLSRIADAGADYSGRSNKIAHHVVLQPDELPAAGPAAILATPGFCKIGFDGAARVLPHAVSLPTAAHLIGVCSRWQDVCKDAGWAGVLVEQTIKNPTRPTIVIFPPGLDVLPLVVEAMSLMPIEQQWRTTFSTFVTKLPAGVECQWRFVLDGASAADQARRNLQSPPIDLTKPAPVPFESPFVTAARTGRPPVQAPQAPPPVPAKTTIPAPAAVAKPVPTTPPAKQAAPAETEPETYRLAKTPSGPPPPKFTPPPKNLFAKHGPSHYVIACYAASGVLFVVIGVLALVKFGLTMTGPATETADVAVQVENKMKDSVAPTGEEKEKIKVKEKKSAKEQPTVVYVAPDPTPKPKNEEPPTEPITRKPIFEDIVAKGRCFSLPERETGNASELCHVELSPSDSLQLKLIAPSLDKQPILKPDDSPAPDGVRLWNVFSHFDDATGGGSHEAKIGQFKLMGQSLFFEWDLGAPSWAEPQNLKLCNLDLSVGSSHETCRLIQTIKQGVERVDFKSRRSAITITGLNFSGDITKLIYYDIALTLGDWSSIKEGISVSDTRPQKFQIPSPTDDDGGKVDIQFTYLPYKQDSPAQFTYQAFFYLRYVDTKEPNREKRVKRARIDELDAPSKEGFMFNDLERLKNKALADRKFAAKQVDEYKRSENLKEQASKNSDESESDNESKKLPDSVDKYQQVLDLEAMEQINRINSRMTDIKQQLGVRFSVYLKTDSASGDNKVVLVETDPSPSAPKRSAIPQEAKPDPGPNENEKK